MGIEESKEELKKILNDFWLLDKEEYENLKSMVGQEVYEIDQILVKYPDQEDEKESRDTLILIYNKLDYIISNGLYKK